MLDENELLEQLKLLRQEQIETLKKLDSIQRPIFAQSGDKKKVLRIDEISFITTNTKGLDIYTTDSEKHINFDSISEIEDQFIDDLRLMKTHKSFIVNLNQIDTVKVVTGGRELTFKGLPVELTAKVTSDVLDQFQKRFGKD